MPQTLWLGPMIKQLRQRWHQLPDYRRASNNTKYTIVDAALAAFSVFFMQSPSFLAHQRDVHQRKGRSNAATLFSIENIPSDNQIRNLLDPISPDHFHDDFESVIDELERGGHLEAFRHYAGSYLVALDGVTYHSSEKIHCSTCSHRKDRSGVTHYYHKAVIAVLVRPDSAHVLSLPPEFIVPQDGCQKQDCERAAAKRWLAQHHDQYGEMTLLGDDLYSNQPLCELIQDTYKQSFVFVCKPDSHLRLYDTLSKVSTQTKQIRRWNGRHGETWTYRFAKHVPLRAGRDALLVNWFELTITHEDTGKTLYHNAWVTNHDIDSETVCDLAKVGRSRWKVENESINVLKTKGYHLEHNFGHGTEHLSSVFMTLNLLAFLFHTVQHIISESYRLLRQRLSVRRTFFNDVKALTRYLVFESWEALFAFMLDGLELDIPPDHPPPFSK